LRLKRACWRWRRPIGLQSSCAQVHEQHIAKLLEIGMAALEIVTAARGESDHQILVYFFDERGVAAYHADTNESLRSGRILGLASSTQPAWHNGVHPSVQWASKVSHGAGKNRCPLNRMQMQAVWG